jgi:superfamily II DNA or RNA helicase
MLSEAFYAVSGFNTRRTPTERRTRFQQMVFDALRYSSKLLRGIVKPRPVKTGYDMEYMLPNGSIAGMVGILEISYRRSKYFVTVSARDISKFVVIPKPTRDNKRGLQDITPDQRDAILSIAKVFLRKGRRVSNPIEEEFKGKIIRWTDSGWTLDKRPWQEQRSRIYRLTKNPDWSKLTSTTIRPVSWSMTFGSGHTFSVATRQFALGRMAGYDPVITIPKINREGKGTDEALTGAEAGAYQYFEYLSEHFPDAIWPSKKKPFAFESSSVQFRRVLCEKLASGIQCENNWPAWQSGLVLKPEQVLAVQEMKASERSGLASFLWMLVGQGKTLTVLRFLEETRRAKYIVWSLPKTAVSSVAKQIKEVGWQPIQLYPSKGLLKKHQDQSLPTTGATSLREQYVYLIEHDHLRRVSDALAPQMGNCAFIFDEVHKAMQSGTKRTAAALRLARISKQLVALTGTPIVDKSGYGLMQWLRLCVPFPVSASNFWVAANSMISPLNTGDVVVEDLILQAPESDEDKTFFKQNFPARAPWHGQLAVPTVQQWSHMKTRTGTIVTNEIVRMAAELVERHIEDDRARHSTDCAREKADPESAWDQNYQRPLIVASSQAHAVEIVHKLLHAGVSAGDILCVGGARPGPLEGAVHHQKTIHLTETAVLSGEEKPYKIVVAALRYCEGYSLTWMTCLITGSYPSNQASRTQMRGRINRLDAQRLRKRYMTILAGTTTITFRYQLAAKMMEDALRKTSTVHKSKKQKSIKF